MEVSILGSIILNNDVKQVQFEKAEKTGRKLKSIPSPYFEERKLHDEYFYAVGLGEDAVLYFKVAYPILDTYALDYIAEAKRRAK